MLTHVAMVGNRIHANILPMKNADNKMLAHSSGIVRALSLRDICPERKLWI